MKALPLAYNKDMQEDKEGIFDSVKTAKDSLIILNAMLKEIQINKENMLNACKKVIYWLPIWQIIWCVKKIFLLEKHIL